MTTPECKGECEYAADTGSDGGGPCPEGRCWYAERGEQIQLPVEDDCDA